MHLRQRARTDLVNDREQVRLKSIMKGARFADVAAIQERVTAVLRSIPKEAFAENSQKLYERC
jgi:fido (protein-threonine AMPylation protein)